MYHIPFSLFIAFSLLLFPFCFDGNAQNKNSQQERTLARLNREIEDLEKDIAQLKTLLNDDGVKDDKALVQRIINTIRDNKRQVDSLKTQRTVLVQVKERLGPIVSQGNQEKVDALTREVNSQNDFTLYDPLFDRLFKGTREEFNAKSQLEKERIIQDYQQAVDDGKKLMARNGDKRQEVLNTFSDRINEKTNGKFRPVITEHDMQRDGFVEQKIARMQESVVLSQKEKAQIQEAQEAMAEEYKMLMKELKDLTRDTELNEFRLKAMKQECPECSVTVLKQ